MTRVLITGGRAPAALELCRSFHAAGADVFVAESRRDILCLASRAVKRSFHVPAPRTQRDEFIRALARIVREQGIDWIVPTCEEIFHVARGRDQLPADCRLFAPDFDLLARLHSKSAFIELAREAGLRVPETRRVQSREELERAFRERGSELVFKPEFSRFGTDTIIRPATSIDVDVSAERPWIVQEALRGTPLATFSVAHEGELALHATYPIEYTAGRAAVHFRPLRHTGVLEWVRTLARATKYTGLLGIDFIDTDEGPQAIECNPRATSGVHLFGEGDRIAAAILRPGAEIDQPDEDARSMLGLPMLFCAARTRSRVALREWFTSWRSARLIIESLSDPGPFLMQVPAFLGLCLSALRHRTSLLEASTLDIEWNGER